MASHLIPGIRSGKSRSEARAHLLALREARLKRWSKDRTAPSKSGVRADDPLLPNDYSAALQMETTGIATQPAVSSQSDNAGLYSPSDREGYSGDDITIPVRDCARYETSSDNCAEELQEPKNTESEPLKEAGIADPEPQAEADAQIKTESPLQDQSADAANLYLPSDDAAKDPLASLPGSGPGLIWMLNKAGIMSLEDLAGAEKSDLSEKMGLLGQILDLDYWIHESARLIER